MSKQQLPDIQTQFSDWYNEVIYRAELADLSPVKGCVVIRPYGYALWENIRDILDKKIKDTGHQNAAFPLLIPESFLKREAKHVEGFSPELAVVTHAGGKELAEPLVIRPTSETIIHYMFARWIKSWRDLPLKINQWANVVRWEMRTRPFLRTTEFFWQEGHTAHETAEQAEQEARLMLAQYVDLAENYLAIPVVASQKSEGEKFPGAITTFTFEGMMQDGKALQMGTSHIISQSFAHAFEMKFQDRNGALAYPHLTSWGATTRLVGAVVMVHGDSKGLILPPKVAPTQIVIIPVGPPNEEVRAAVDVLEQQLKKTCRVEADHTEKTAGAKFHEWELKGVPLRLELGPRDLACKSVVAVERLSGAKHMIPFDEMQTRIPALLDSIQDQLYKRAFAYRQQQWHKATTLAQIVQGLESAPGFYQTGWCGTSACEAVLKEHKASIRCVYPENSCATCFNCGQPSTGDILIAKSY